MYVSFAPEQCGAMVTFSREAFDALVANGRFHETGRRMVDDLAPGERVKVFCGEESRTARVELFHRPSSKKNLVIEWTIALVHGT